MKSGKSSGSLSRFIGLALGPIIAGLCGGALILAPTVFQTSPSAKVVGGNLPINPGATDLRDVTANNSPALVRNPLNGANLVVSNRIDSPAFSCALHVSFDGAASWSQTPLPVPPGEEPKCFAPDVGFGADGTLYLAFVTLKGDGNVPNAVWISRSTDGGRSLSDPVKALGALSFQVRLTIDPARKQVLHLTWLRAARTGTLSFPEIGYPIEHSVSVDGGGSWSEPKTVNPANRLRVVAPTPAISRDGRFYVLYLDLKDDRLDYSGAHEGRGGEPYPGTWQLVLARSEDGGTSWKDTVVESRLVPTERFIVFIPPFPSLAIDDKRGRVYAGFQDGRLGDADVQVWASQNKGASFLSGVRVNDTPPKDGTSQYLPKLAVTPSGRLDVVYYDRRSDKRNIMNEASLQSSFDGAETFNPRLRLSDIPFDSRIGFGRERGLPDLGTRLAMLSTDDRALAVWPDTRAGTADSLKQDLVRALAAVTPPEQLPGPIMSLFRWAGGVVVLAAAIWLIARLLKLFPGAP